VEDIIQRSMEHTPLRGVAIFFLFRETGYSTVIDRMSGALCSMRPYGEECSRFMQIELFVSAALILVRSTRRNIAMSTQMRNHGIRKPRHLSAQGRYTGSTGSVGVPVMILDKYEMRDMQHMPYATSGQVSTQVVGEHHHAFGSELARKPRDFIISVNFREKFLQRNARIHMFRAPKCSVKAATECWTIIRAR
jgi:hypothetical protein